MPRKVDTGCTATTECTRLKNRRPIMDVGSFSCPAWNRCTHGGVRAQETAHTAARAHTRSPWGGGWKSPSAGQTSQGHRGCLRGHCHSTTHLFNHAGPPCRHHTPLTPAMEQQLPVHSNVGVSNSGQCPPVHSNLAVPGSGQRIREPPVSLGGRCPTRLYGLRESSKCAANKGPVVYECSMAPSDVNTSAAGSK